MVCTTNMQISTYAHTHTRTHTSIHAYAHTHPFNVHLRSIDTSTHPHTTVCTHTHARTHTSIHAYAHTHPFNVHLRSIDTSTHPHTTVCTHTHAKMPFTAVPTWGVGKRHVKAGKVDQCVSGKEEHWDHRCNHIQVTCRKRKQKLRLQTKRKIMLPTKLHRHLNCTDDPSLLWKKENSNALFDLLLIYTRLDIISKLNPTCCQEKSSWSTLLMV